MRVCLVLISIAVGGLWLALSGMPVSVARDVSKSPPGCFVPNVGQWQHPASFVWQGGTMTAFLERRGWILDLQQRDEETEALPRRIGPQFETDKPQAEPKAVRRCAVRMSFVGADEDTRLVGEDTLPGHCNYFLGSDDRRWRTDVPRHASVLYRGLYSGIDVRVRQADGNLEYDLLCDPNADLDGVVIAVEGADCLSIDTDGSLVIHTSLGPVRQPVPVTWTNLADGSRRAVDCEYVLLADNRFGFVASGWNRARSLVIDPSLLWSGFVGGSASDHVYGLVVDARGVVTVLGKTPSSDYPTTLGAYATAYSGGFNDVIVTRLDPRKKGASQLVFSTYLGGRDHEGAYGLSVDPNGVVTLAGETRSPDYPTTAGAYDTTYNGLSDVVVSRLDPRKKGTAQLVYSTYLGGRHSDGAYPLSVDAAGVITLAGWTMSSDYPSTAGDYDTSHNGGSVDAFVSRLDPRKSGAAQLTWSTFLGGREFDFANGLAVDSGGVLTVVGETRSKDYPTTGGACDVTFNGASDVFVSRLDPKQSGTAQLRYSTYLGGSKNDFAYALDVDARGVLTVAGYTTSDDYPTTGGAYGTKFGGGTDIIVSRLDPSRKGTTQLTWSTYLASRDFYGYEYAHGLSVDNDGVVTVSGYTRSKDYPTTSGAFDRTHNGYADVIVSRLDPRVRGLAQLIYSTYVGGGSDDRGGPIFVDGRGVATVIGDTASRDFPTTKGAYDTTLGGGTDAFVFRLDLWVAARRYFKIDGDSAVDVFGFSVAGAGDVDRDGYPDLIVGAVGDDNNVKDSGSARVLSGKNGRVLYTFDGDSTLDAFGFSVAGAGDVNRDGHADVIVGAPDDDDKGTDSGSARVLSGKDGRILFTFYGNAAGDKFGESVAGAGDVNKDGHADLIVGAAGNDSNGVDSGSAFVFSGKNGKLLYAFRGRSAGDRFGECVAGALDVNRDGYPDLVAGASEDDTWWLNAGSVRVLSGKDGKTLYTFYGDWAGSRFGRAVAGPGDVNRDGYADLFVGAPGDRFRSGSARLLSGKDGSILYTFRGDSDNDYFGYPVASVGDVDGDGHPDLGVGAMGDDNTGDRSGSVRVLSGRDGSVLFGADGDSPCDYFGGALAAAGDVNRDGYADLIVGAAFDDDTGTDAGAVTVLSGKVLELTGDTHRLSSKGPGTHELTIDLTAKYGGRNYWIFGSATGMHPGVALPTLTLPLIVDAYTSFLAGATNSSAFRNFRGRLDAAGRASASVHIPPGLPSLMNVGLYHACVVYDGRRFLQVTNAVPLHFHN